MDPITLIVTALAAGASIGLNGIASWPVNDDFRALKFLARKCLAGRPTGDLVVIGHERAPETWDVSLAAELTAAWAGNDAELLAAQALMSLVDEADFRSGKYAVDVHGSTARRLGITGLSTTGSASA